MRLISKKTLLPAAALAGATGALIFSFTPLEAQSGGATYRATLSPLNNSGASGEAVLTKFGQTLRVGTST